MAGKGAVALRQFTKCKLRTGGRNSQGRITSFHRGGGAKRLLRKIDLKRNTSGVGIVERIEYDPNRSSKIALVRWIEGATPPLRRGDRRSAAEDPSPASSPNKNPESIKATSDGGKFSFSTLPGVIEQTHFGGIITSAFSAKGSLDGLRGLPRVSVAGAKPSFFASSVKEEHSDGEFPLSKIQEWRPDRQIWIHRMKRKAAISWQSIRRHSTQASSSSNLDRGEGLLALLRL